LAFKANVAPSVRHNARSPIAGSFLGGFRTPATVYVAPSIIAGIRNPAQKATYAVQQTAPYSITLSAREQHRGHFETE